TAPPASTDTTAPGDTSTTTPTTPPTPTTQFASTDVHGKYQPAPRDASSKDTFGIHSHGDGLIHIHPFLDSAAGRKATMDIFLTQVGISITDNTLTLGTGDEFTEGKTKC